MDTKIKSKYLQVMISCEIRQQGLNILQALIEKQLAFEDRYLVGPQSFYGKAKLSNTTIVTSLPSLVRI